MEAKPGYLFDYEIGMGMGKSEKNMSGPLSSRHQITSAILKIFNLVLAFVFFVFAYLQLNDTPGDILFWFLIYAYTGFTCGFAAFNKYNMWIIVLGIIVLLYQIFRMFPVFSQWIVTGCPSIVGEKKASSPLIGFVREFLGLCICMAVLIYQYVRYAWLKRVEAGR